MANRSLDMVEEKIYREEVRNLLFNEVANAQRKYRTCRYFPDDPLQHHKNYSLRATQITQEFGAENAEDQRRVQMDQAKASGGDADRFFYDAAYTSVNSGDSRHFRNDHCHALRHNHSITKDYALAMPNKSNAPVVLPTEECVGDHRCLCESISNMGDTYNASEGGSSKSQKSSKTVMSRKSSHELRKLVKSQCKLQEAIDETLQAMCNPEDIDKNHNEFQNKLCGKSGTQLETLPLTQCKHCTDDFHPSQSSQKDVTTEIGKTDFTESHNGNSLTISVDDVVNSKVINPMIRKLQRMYLNNLKDEMSLMEDLERLPQKVNEVYKATILKQRE